MKSTNNILLSDYSNTLNFHDDVTAVIKQSFIDLSNENFITMINKMEAVIQEAKEFNERLKKEDILNYSRMINLPILDIKVAKILFSFIGSKEFNPNHTKEYFDIFTSKFKPELFTFILWANNKKDLCIPIFESKNLQMNEDQFNWYCFYMNPYNSLSGVGEHEVEETIAKEVQEFLYYQKNAPLLKELHQLPSKIKNEKKPKL